MSENYIIGATYGTMRFLGSASRSICKGFYFIFPFMKPKEESHYAQRNVAKVYSGASSVETKPIEARPAIRPTIPKAQEAHVARIEKEERPVETDSLLRGIDFESKLERVQAEIYVRDFDSKLTKTRDEALEQLKRLSKGPALEILKRLLKTKVDPLQVIELLNTLAGLNDDGSVDERVFIDFLRHKNSSIKLAAMRAISKYKNQEAFSILVSSLKDEDAEIRRQALNLLCWTYGVKCAPQALMLLHDVDNHVRKTAIQISGALKLRETISALITFLSDPDREIQKSVVESLRKITGENFGFKVSGSMKSKDEAIEAWRFWWRDNQATFLSRR